MGKENTVLIVDDEVNQRKVLGDILKQNGYTPTAVAKGRSALAWVKEEKPAVVLIDLKLPDISGLEVLKGIREHSPKTACIILTGHGSETIASQVVNQGAYGYLRKPYEIEQLLLLMLRAVEQQRSERMLRETHERLNISIEQMPTAYIVWDSKGCIQEWNKAAQRIFGYTSEEVLGKRLVELVVPEKDRAVVEDVMERVLAGKSAHYSENENNLGKDGRLISCDWWNTPLFGSNGQIFGALSIALDVTERRQLEEKRQVAEHALKDRVRQQAGLAELGELALTAKDLPSFLDGVVQRLSETLEMEYCKILELLPDGEKLLLKSGVGWKEGLVGHAKVKSDLNSQAGYTLQTDDPVIVQDFSSETRFSSPLLLLEHDVSSGMSVVIRGRNRPFGVLGVHSKGEREFTQDDVRFLSGVAALISQVVEKRRIEKERQRLASAVENTDDVVFMTDIDGKITYVNPAFEKVYGFSSQEALGKTPRILKSGKMTPEYYENFWAGLLAGKPRKGEHINRSKNGQIVIAEATVNPILDSTKKLTGYVAVQKDVTARKKAQDKLRTSQQRFHTIFQESPIPLWEENFSKVRKLIVGLKEGGVKDFRKYLDDHPETVAKAASKVKITGLNKAVLKLHEAQSEEKLLAGLPALFVEESYHAFKEELIAIAEGRTSIECEASVNTMTGVKKEIDLKWVVLPGHEKFLDRVLISTLDITDRKQAEARLKKSEEQYRSIVESSASAVIVADEKMNIVSWNPSAQKMFEYDEQEVMGQPVTMLMPERYREDHSKGVSRILSTHGSNGPVRRVQLHALKKSGGEFPVEIALSSWPTESGRFFSAVMRDLSEEQKLKEQLLHSQKMEALGILAGGVAHDFNNILTGINGLSSLALEEVESDSAVCDDLKEIHALGKRAAGLTRQLLTFSRQLPPEVKQLNLDSLIQNLIKMLTRVIGEDIELKFKPNAESDTIRADAGQIEQILMNLAVNSRDAMLQGGELTIQTERVELSSSRGEVGAGAYVILTVSDSGCGMNDETRSRIFDPFFTTKEVGKGTGLGLSTVYGIVTQHDGHIEVESTPGEGTTFRIYLPSVVKKDEELALEDESECQSQAAETILVVEDEESVRSLVDRLLKKQGYQLISASSSKEAQSLLSQNVQKVDLLLTDVVMPGGNGLKLYHKMLAQDPTLKVLFMSGYTNSSIKVQLLDPDFPFLQKPFALGDLARKVREVLDQEITPREGEKKTAPKKPLNHPESEESAKKGH